MRLANMIRLFFLCLIVVGILFMVYGEVVYASDDDGHGHGHGHGHGSTQDVTQDVNVTGGDSSMVVEGSKDRAYAFSHSLGDVDINQCMASSQWSTILVSKQKLLPNLWCMAESYDARGLYRMASLMRCDIEIIRSHFGTDEECWDANTIVAATPGDSNAHVEEDEEHARQELMVAALAEQVAQLQSLVEKAPAPRPRVIERTVVENTGLTAEQKAQLREVVK